VGGVQSGSLTYEQFANIIGGKREFPDTKEDIMGAFHAMGDKAGTGKIDEKRMRAILTSFGSKLSQEEVSRRPRPTARARARASPSSSTEAVCATRWTTL
jgi:Ca2+-binding EF-hand superfamily protein